MDGLRKLEEAAASGDGEAQLACARAYTDIAMEKRRFFQSLPSGSSALRGPARHLETGGFEQEIARDMQIAFGWYQKAAEHGIADAVYELSLCYEEGEGTAPFPEKAQELLEKAAELGHMEAQFRLAMQFYEGHTVVCDIKIEKNYEKAVYWLEKGAAQGDNFAQYYLGLCYENGTGVGQNYEKAVSLYHRAADCEYPQAEAIFELAHCYETGHGVKLNIPRAIELYRRAAEEGDIRAALKLGDCYERGFGVEKSKERAIEWYNIAAEQGDEDGISALYRLSS